MEITKKYNKPPLEELVCEFQFPVSAVDFIEMQNKFGEKVSKFFPVKKERKAFNINIKNDKGKVTSEGEEKQSFIQFISQNGNSMAQINQSVLAVNHIKPYTKWEDFLPIVTKNLSIYSTIAKQNKIIRATVRYINKIEIESGSGNFADYFAYTPIIPKPISAEVGSILLRTEHLYNKNRDVLTISLMNFTPVTTQKVGFIFDIGYHAIKAESITFESVSIWLKIAHERLNEAFESCLTDTCKKLFD